MIQLKLKALAVSLPEWRKKSIAQIDNISEHILKYQLWHTDVLIKEIYAYTLRLCNAKIKTTNKYPNEKMLKSILNAILEDETIYRSMLVAMYEVYESDYSVINFNKLNIKKMYADYQKFIDSLCIEMAKGGLSYSMSICKNIVKKYL